MIKSLASCMPCCRHHILLLPWFLRTYLGSVCPEIQHLSLTSVKPHILRVSLPTCLGSLQPSASVLWSWSCSCNVHTVLMTPRQGTQARLRPLPTRWFWEVEIFLFTGNSIVGIVEFRSVGRDWEYYFVFFMVINIISTRINWLMSACQNKAALRRQN